MHAKPPIAAMIGVILITISPAARATPPDDACSLLTQSQVSAASGISMGTSVPIGANLAGRLAPTFSKTCGWNEAGSTSPTAKRVVLAMIILQSFATGKIPFQGFTKTPVNSVGDDAYYMTTPGFGTGLNVQKAGSALQVRVYGFPVDQIKSMDSRRKRPGQNVIVPPTGSGSPVSRLSAA
jgi:hypothetical protein